MAKLSPMMLNIRRQKNSTRDCILFYRLGDFYEMFFEDAVTVSRELKPHPHGEGVRPRGCGRPCAASPYHAVESYLTKLVQKGYKVAIAEQMEDPKLAKGLVRREVIRVVTPELSPAARPWTRRKIISSWASSTWGTASASPPATSPPGFLRHGGAVGAGTFGRAGPFHPLGDRVQPGVLYVRHRHG